MKRLFNFEASSFDADSEFAEELGLFDTELAEKFEWEGEINRRSGDYIRWVQQSLNKILGLRLAEDGIAGSKTRSAVRSFQRRRGLESRTDGVICPRTEQALIAAGANPPPSIRVPFEARSQETTPPARTVYVDIPLQIPLGKAKSMTGIFVPEDYCPLSSVDLIIYLHGFKLRSHKPDYSIDAYWRLPQFLLREEVNKSKKNVILVAPSLGPKNEPGSLTCHGGFDKFLDQVMMALKQYGPYAGGQKNPSIGNIILACHSGSGSVMRAIAMGTDTSATQIQECWAFDPYNIGDANGWKNWARSRQKAKLYIYYLSNSPGQRLCQNLMGGSMPKRGKINCMPNVFAEKSIAGHDAIPRAYLKDRIQGAQFLVDKSNCPTNRTRNRTSAISNKSRFREAPVEFYSEFDEPVESWDSDWAEEVWQKKVPRNSPDYICWVQRSLNKALRFRLAEDGIAGPLTRSAIRNFQRREGLPVTGTIGHDSERVLIAETGGIPNPTYRTGQEAFEDEEMSFESEDEEAETQILEIAPPPIPVIKQPLPVPPGDPVPFAPPPPIGSYWPVRTRHKYRRLVSYKAVDGTIVGKGRMFLANREGKRDNKVVPRWHVGVDLFANVGDVVVACGDGKIVGFAFFYPAKSGQRTYQLLIEHSGVVVNYGEVTGDSLDKNGLRIGMPVKAGQPIGFVSDTSMLHFETYVKGATHSYRWFKDARKPPPQLLNPTKYLLFLREHGLVGESAGRQPVPSVPATPEKISDEKVRWIQTILNAVQGERLKVDGDYRANTRGAVKRFQEQHGLLATGEVDQATNIALIQRALEEIRKQSLFPQIGVMDNKTFEEIKRFQSENGLEPDGLIGRRTRKAMVNKLTRTLPSVSEGIQLGCAQFRCPDFQARLRRIKPLVPLLSRHRGDIPMYLLLGWVAHESGGRLDVITRLNERGYFQIHPDESRTLVIDHARLSVDPEYSIVQGIALVRHRASGANRIGFAPGTDLYWRVAKLLHWLPAGVNAIVSLMKKQGFKPTSWEQFKQFTMDHRKEVLEALERKYGKKNLVDTGWDPARGIANAEKVFCCGKELASALGAL
jgi:peptidoglycan hydrolase-like protein with peptidoglycan-binding domain